MSPSPDARAQKRAALGLSPHRPTAKATVARPPDPPRTSRALILLPIGLILIIGLTIFLMLGAGSRLSGFVVQADDSWSDWSWARLTPPDSPLNAPPTTAIPTPDRGAPGAAALTARQTSPRLLVTDTFSQAEAIFAVRDVAGQWRTEHIPQQAVYRVETWPNHVAWSLLDVTPEVWGALEGDAGLRIQTAATVASHTPWGFAGLVVRVQEGRQLILFVVDGRGRYSVQVIRAGQAEFAVPWTHVDALNPAGTGNLLMVEDDGDTMRFFGNQFPLFQMRVTEWEQGQLGIAAGTPAEGAGEAHFEWFQLYAYVSPTP